jgi:hypothetical protein
MTPAMLLSAALVFVGGGAQVAPPMTTQDEQRLLAVVGAARERVEFHGGRVRVFVIGPTIDEPAGAVLKRALGAITQDEVPRDPAFKLPAGYFLLKSLRVRADQATLSGTLGRFRLPAKEWSFWPVAPRSTLTSRRHPTAGLHAYRHSAPVKGTDRLTRLTPPLVRGQIVRRACQPFL